MTSRPFAFFDLDGTLLPIDTQLLFHDYVLRHAGRWRAGFLFVFLPCAALHALGLVSTKIAKRAFLSYLCGLSHEQIDALAKPFVEEMVRPLLFPEVMHCLEQERRQGAVLILNTASPSIYAPVVARQLGFHHCFCTEVIQEEKFPLLPVIAGENNKHEAKLIAMAALLPAERPISNSCAYSDSAADLPMLRLASSAVLIHPRTLLRLEGEKQNWKELKPRLPWNSNAEKIGVFLRLLLGFNLPKRWLRFYSSRPLA